MGKVVRLEDLVDADRSANKTTAARRLATPLERNLFFGRGPIARQFKAFSSRAVAEECVGPEVYNRYATAMASALAPLHLKISIQMVLPIQHRGGHIIEL